ncbi:uncharacterized protein DUF3472 [Rahnella sp. BIGb0236]|uniref:DUF3472 domain-containing protein n=1 Tax=Rahnella sp. BIGb0236 TaxID=2485117 RepID=UPI00105B2039|nr:DUF3472 domain-containing protein [Rahnella sp. BIGb0236]TDS84857.1 uncharacterized protein DUF3472 [Rahnella sp. BIGb0236]
MKNEIERNVNFNNSNLTDVPTWGPSLTSYFEKNEAELIYVEQMVPSDGDKVNIYWSGCNFYFGERGAYAGIQHQNDVIRDGQVFTRNNICSIWDLDDLDPSLPTEVTLTYGLPGLYSSHFGGEGTGLHTSHPMPWVQNQWYALVIRRWDNPVGSKTTGMGMFMYSYLESKWTHYMSADIPGESISLTGNSCNGFIERFAGDEESYYGIYGQRFRMDKDGVWEKPTTYLASAGGKPSLWNAELYQDANIKLSVGTSTNTEELITLMPNQWEDKPKLVVSPVILKLTAAYVKESNITNVSWELDESTPPQLTFTVEIRKSGTDGDLVISHTETSPHKRDIQLDTGDLQSGTYYITFEFYDIFNQKSNFGYNSFEV